jgi:hypothetical protein
MDNTFKLKKVLIHAAAGREPKELELSPIPFPCLGRKNGFLRPAA